MTTPKTIRLFFSWQSDLPKDTTTNSIREALTLVANEIEEASPGIKIVIEEATSNIPGSPDIPAMIFDRISLSDIVVSDITTINGSSDSKRKTANPNVLLELGFALSQLGWERVILLFNEQYGDFPGDVAFDIDKKRIGKFSISSKTDKSGKGNLKSLLLNAINLIIAHNPKKPAEKKSLSVEEKRKSLDVINLKWVLSKINIEFLDRHIANCPDKIDTRILYFYEGFSGVLKTSNFFLYDKTAEKYLAAMSKNWADSLSSEVYRDTADPNIHKFGYSPASGRHLTDQDLLEFAKMTKAIKNLKSNWSRLLNHIRYTYLEIDINELSRHAYEEWVSYDKD